MLRSVVLPFLYRVNRHSTCGLAAEQHKSTATLDESIFGADRNETLQKKAPVSFAMSVFCMSE